MSDDYFSHMVALGETLQGLSKWSEICQQQINAIEQATALKPLAEIGTRYGEVFNSVVPKQVEMLKALDASWDRELLTKTLSLQMKAISAALQCVQTQTIKSLLKSFNQVCK